MPGTDRPVMLFLAYNALLFIGLIGISDAILNFYFVSLGHSPQTIGLLQSLPRVSGFLSSVPIGLMANRLGTRRITLYGTFGLALTFGLLVVWPSQVGLGVNRFMFGFFYGAVQIASTPLLIALAPPKFQTHAFSYLNVVSMGATAIASVIGGFLPLVAVRLFPQEVTAAQGVAEQTPFAYRFALIIAGLAVLVSTLPLLKLNGRAASLRPRVGLAEVPGRTPWRTLLWLSSPLLLFGFTGGLTFPFYNLFFRATFDVPDTLVGTILSLGWLGMALVPLADPWWERRLGRAWAVAATMAIAAAAFLGLSVAPTLGISILCYVMAISFRNVMQPLYQPLLMGTLPPDLHNLTSSVGMVLWNVGWFSATAISGVWQERYGFGMIMQVVALGVLLDGLSVVAIFRRRPPYQGEPDDVAAPAGLAENAA